MLFQLEVDQRMRAAERLTPVLPSFYKPLTAHAALTHAQVTTRDQHLLRGTTRTSRGPLQNAALHGRPPPLARAQRARHLPTGPCSRLHRHLTRKTLSEPCGCCGSPALRNPAAAGTPADKMGPANNPLPSAAQLRSSPAARDHRPPRATLRAAPPPFTAGEPKPPYTSAAPARCGLTFILLTSRRRGERPHFRPHLIHTPRNSRESSTARAPRDRR